MKLIVGLGNPGPEYDGTRHNVGFAVLDRLARRLAPGAVARSRYQGVTIEARVEDSDPASRSAGSDADGRVLLLKPTTFMNRSGQSVAEAAAFFKLLPARDVLIIVDDTALPCGTIRIRPTGSAGGHNGLADIEQKLGTIEYARLRIGVDSPGQIPQKDYVLGRFRPDQSTLVESSLEDAVDASLCWITRGVTETMNRFNRKETPSELSSS